MKRAGIAAMLLVAAACGRGAEAPAALLPGVACSHCRMAVSDPKLAAQLVAPGEEPRFFDDIGCLAAFLREHPAGAGSAAYVADHSSGSWVAAGDAVYSRADAISTPMGSHIIAHTNDAARAADETARHAARLTARDVFGAAGAPGGTR